MSLQKRRTDRGWSQEDLALHSGLSVRTIQRIEAGNKAGLESLKSLAAVFETSVSELVEEQNMTQATPHTSVDARMLEDTEKQALAYVKNLKAFHMNWIAFLIIMPILVLLNLYVSPGVYWVIIVGLAWAGAILLHAVTIHGLFSVFGPQWEQRQFRKTMRKHLR